MWSFYCPISNELMEDPVVSRFGHLYDRKSIEEWIEREGTCPFTNEIMDFGDLYPVYALRNDIIEYKKRKVDEHTTSHENEHKNSNDQQ